jgi:hypothetical protein
VTVKEYLKSSDFVRDVLVAVGFLIIGIIASPFVGGPT